MKTLRLSTISLAAVVSTILVAVVQAQAPTPAETPSAASLGQLLAARPAVNQALTLDQAVAIAQRESPVVRGAVEEVQAAIERLRAAQAETRPWLSANTFLSGGSNSNITRTPQVTQPEMIMGLPRSAFFDQNLMLMYPLYTGGRLSAMIRQATALRNASQADLETRRQEVALMTRLAYREALARQALVGVWQARLREDQERLRIDREQFQVGAVALVTVRRDEAEVAATQQELTNAQRDVEISLLQLKTVMGVHPTSRIELTETLEYKPSANLIKRLIEQAPAGPGTKALPLQRAPAPPKTRPARQTSPPDQTTPPVPGIASSDDLHALLRLAEEQRPEIQAASQRVRGAQAETDVARSAFLPQVNVFAMGDFMKMKGDDPFTGATFGLVASLPLYNGGQRRARVQIAEAERRRQEQERAQIALQVGQEVNTALLNLHAAEQNVQTARAALAAAQESYRVMQERFRAGRSVLVELLDALAARTEAESNVVQALFQYNAAQDQLLRAVGALNTSAPTRPGKR